MAKIQVALDDEENMIIDVYRAKQRLSSKEKAIKHLIRVSKKEVMKW
ncbi:DUF2683 family protein [Candidatus Woesearchaeota archaeon]|nr:DUF2683 family protein [Candidatus Woesearchaeota archaeon]